MNLQKFMRQNVTRMTQKLRRICCQWVEGEARYPIGRLGDKVDQFAKVVATREGFFDNPKPSKQGRPSAPSAGPATQGRISSGHRQRSILSREKRNRQSQVIGSLSLSSGHQVVTRSRRPRESIWRHCESNYRNRCAVPLLRNWPRNLRHCQRGFSSLRPRRPALHSGHCMVSSTSKKPRRFQR